MVLGKELRVNLTDASRPSASDRYLRVAAIATRSAEAKSPREIVQLPLSWALHCGFDALSLHLIGPFDHVRVSCLKSTLERGGEVSSSRGGQPSAPIPRGGGIRRRPGHDSRRRSEAGCHARQAWARGRLIKPKPMRGLKADRRLLLRRQTL
jgi:hypothetical protein